MTDQSLPERLRASPTSQIMLEAADRIKDLQVQAQYEADVAEAALEAARELSAEKAELERIIGQQAETIGALDAGGEVLRQALRHLYHNAKASGAEMGLALDVARAALSGEGK